MGGKNEILRHVRRIIKKEVKTSTRIFSVIFLLGFLFLILSFVLIMIPIKSSLSDKNSELIASANKWNAEKKIIDLKEKIIELSLWYEDRKMMEFNLNYEEEKDQSSIFSKKIHVPTAYFSTKIPNNYKMDKICLNFNGTYTQCYELKNPIKQDFNLSILQNYVDCKNSDDCLQQCKKIQYDSINDSLCKDAELNLKEICLTYDFQNKKSVLNSCFNTKQQKYNFYRETEGTISFFLKDVNDPSLLKYKLGDNFSPFEPEINFLQFYSKLCIIVSALCFGILGFWGLLSKIREINNDKEIESLQFIEENSQKS